MRQKILVSVSILLLFMVIFGCCQASQISQEYIKKAKQILYDYAEKDISSYLENIIEQKRANLDVVNILKRKITEQFSSTFRQISLIFIIALLYILIASVQTGLKNQSVSNVTFLAFFFTEILIVLQNLKGILLDAQQTVENACNFAEVFFPLFVSLIASMGYPTYATAISPKIMFAIVFSSEFLKNIISPFAYTYILLSILSNIDSGRLGLRRVLNLCKTILMWSILIGIVVFVAIVSVEGIANVTVDSLITKSIKYSVGNFVPFVGKILSDAADTIATSLAIVKNSLGMIGLIVLLIGIGISLLKILVVFVVFRIAAIFVGLVGDTKLAQLLDDYADILILIFAISFAALCMFVVTFSSSLFLLQVGR
ncbi:stage III sporulation protein AE [Anaerocellum diazotrophicum]|uniref:Stage III sporulation protein AE n=1 Tax=Caldicellulosiruptor diazotrophicus TaxID=2806205 RepID=A0ABN6E7X0_9FIRM|nr:stage III sporulation protein AE [Caldicellulosiruptor diazotrophicus]BCS81548.1 stage III sporulation protein AE [Caldicellulosiruptor diazotrophicus]